MRKLALIVLLVLVYTSLGMRQRYESASTGLVAHYKMNDNLATDVIIDETGSHNGTFKDATGDPNTDAHDVSGKINGALDFDGTDDYIEVAHHADFTPISTPFSISGWMNPNDSEDCPLATKGVLFTNGEWDFGLYDDDYIYFILVDKDAAAWIGRTAQISAEPHQDTDFYDWLGWLHIVGTYDGGISSSGIKIYVNGVRVDETTYNYGTFVAIDSGLGAAVVIGKRDAAYTNGLIDNVMFFSTVLTPSQVSKIYNSGRGTESPDTLRERY